MTERQDGGCILIVDDDITARMMASVALEQAGFTVAEAANGQQALDEFAAIRPDLILMDVMMPEMDGYTACQRIRLTDAGAHTPILMLTGLDDLESINRAYEAGATDFATKPINFLLLPHRVLYMLRAKRTADELRASEARLANAQRIAKLGHFEWNVETGQFECSPQIGEIFGLRSGERIDSQEALLRHVFPEDRDVFADMIQTAIHERRRYAVEHRILRGDDTVRTVYQEGEFITGTDRPGLWLSGTIQDVTERRRMEKQVHQLAFYDGVTGLPNRTFMRRQLAQALNMAQRHNRIMAVMVMDVDHFGRINDTLGHKAGDELLREVARRIVNCVRGGPRDPRTGEAINDTAARMGGDEFAIVLTEVQAAEDAALIARRIREALTPPCVVGDTEVAVTVSIGISVFPIDSRDAESLLKQADAAMRHAKNMGRDRYQFSTATINARAFERLSLENNLRKALAAGQFELHYQPKVRMSDGVPMGMEALVRWRHPDLGMVSPAEFIPVAEETGLIVPLGEWILREACRQVRAWQDEGLPPLIVSVNLSAAQFRQEGLRGLVAGIVGECRLDPAFLELEMTESLLMNDLESSIRLMHDLTSVGLSMSIDDFGVGYSSLSYLKRFPIHTLKVDQSFVRDTPDDADDAAIVTAIIALAHSLRLKVVAEGVEHEAQLQFLKRLRCDAIQGYYFSRPLPPAEFSAWIRKRC